MARYRKVEVITWNDDRFRSLSAAQPNGQTLWLYLLSGPRTTSFPGLVVGREEVMASDLGWNVEAFREAFREASTKGLAKADWRAGVVVLRKALLDSTGEPRDTARPESPNVIKSWSKSWDEIPDCHLKTEYLRNLESFTKALGEAFGEAFRQGFRKALVKASTHPSLNQDQEQKQEQKQEQDPCDPPAAVAGSGRRGRPTKEPEPAISEHRQAIASFDARYQAAYGSRPTWGEKQGAQIKALLKAHGLAEFEKRSAILFTSPPGWLDPPFDLGTLVLHFDKLSRPAAVRAPLSRSQGALDLQADRIRMLEAQEAKEES